MNSKLLIGFIVLVVIVGGLVILGGSKKETGQQPATPTTPASQTQSTQRVQDTIVTVSSSGFSPDTLTVKAGTRVMWTNKSGSAISVNSDTHPTHKLFPQLNLGEVPSGASISLIFDRAGTYKYHNHYNPSQAGTVVVE